MKFVRYATSGSAPTWGVLEDETVHSLAAHPAGEPVITDLGSEGYRQAVRAVVDRGGLPTLSADEVDLLTPVPTPGKIVCAGLNYRDHAEEQNQDIPESPLLFGKAPTAINNPGGPIVLPEEEKESQVDYEAELGVVIGETADSVSREEAADHIAGYTVANDVSGRDAQFEDGQWFRGKSFDTFCPLGPALQTGEGFDPNAVDIACRVNGETRQSSNTEQFIFDVHDLVAYISDNMTLRPGDVVLTGTPGGVGVFSDPKQLLEAGDTVEVEIEGIGTLTNPVIEG